MPDGYRDASRIMFTGLNNTSNIQLARYADEGSDFAAFQSNYQNRVAAELSPFAPKVIRSDALSSDRLKGSITVYALAIAADEPTQVQAHICTVHGPDVVVVIWTGKAGEYRREEAQLLLAASELKLIGAKVEQAERHRVSG